MCIKVHTIQILSKGKAKSLLKSGFTTVLSNIIKYTNGNSPFFWGFIFTLISEKQYKKMN